MYISTSLQTTASRTLFGVGLLTVLLVGGLGWLAWPERSPRRVPAVEGAPIILRTPGGALEVAAVGVREAFSREDSARLLGLDLGTTRSQIRLDVTYRFQIGVQARWPVYFDAAGKVATVYVSSPRAVTPVAFDTRRAEKTTQSGWARFDKWENLAALEASISEELQRRAPAYAALSRPAAEETVREFVRTWLVQGGHTVRDDLRIEVRFQEDLQRGLP